MKYMYLVARNMICKVSIQNIRINVDILVNFKLEMNKNTIHYKLINFINNQLI